jgi:hypothetical protein
MVTVERAAGQRVTRGLWPHDLLDRSELKRTLLQAFEEAKALATATA